jgi:Mrp family chromosome partitioning ATPase
MIIGLVVLGIVAVNIFKAIQGPRYEAEARVLISTTTLASILTKTEPSFVDPQRVQQTALGIADSPVIYANAATDTDERYGDAAELESAVTASSDPDSDLITFTASTDATDSAVGSANAVAEAYIDFRDELASEEIRDAIELLQSRIPELPEGSVESANLSADLARLEVLEGAPPSGAQLVEPAESADQVSPAPLTDSLLGLSIGLVIALLAVALREAIDTTVRTENDVEDVLAAPILASVRRLPRRTRMVTSGRHEASFADTYALLAAQLARRGRDKGGVVLAITSASSQEGKTTTAANLGVALARRGKRVIVADFDFRKASIEEIFGIPEAAKGALHVMAGSASIEEALWEAPSYLITGASENGPEQPPGSLHVLPSGGVIPARKVPQRARLASLLGELREQADIVILDTPPALLTVEVTELSALIDTVLIVVRQGRVSQRNLRALSRQANSWPAEVAGVVMTDVRTGGEYSYYGGS